MVGDHSSVPFILFLGPVLVISTSIIIPVLMNQRYTKGRVCIGECGGSPTTSTCVPEVHQGQGMQSRVLLPLQYSVRVEHVGWWVGVSLTTPPSWG